MQAQILIYPMAMLILLNVIVMSMMLFFRVKAVRARKVSPRYFKRNKGGDLPDHLEGLSQNYNNLLELPLLFYIVCLAIIGLKLNAEEFVVYAWLYVGFRYIHSYIHITYNHILHRLFVFTASCFVLMAMWINVVLSVSSNT